MDAVIVSADDHLDMHTLPPDLWTERLPARYHDHAPRVVEVNGGKQWQIDGAALGPERQPRLARRQGRRPRRRRAPPLDTLPAPRRHGPRRRPHPRHVRPPPLAHPRPRAQVRRPRRLQRLGRRVQRGIAGAPLRPRLPPLARRRGRRQRAPPVGLHGHARRAPQLLRLGAHRPLRPRLRPELGAALAGRRRDRPPRQRPPRRRHRAPARRARLLGHLGLHLDLPDADGRGPHHHGLQRRAGREPRLQPRPRRVGHRLAPLRRAAHGPGAGEARLPRQRLQATGEAQRPLPPPGLRHLRGRLGRREDARRRRRRQRHVGQRLSPRRRRLPPLPRGGGGVRGHRRAGDRPQGHPRQRRAALQDRRARPSSRAAASGRPARRCTRRGPA